MLFNLLFLCLLSSGDSVRTNEVRAIVVDAETKARLRDATVTINGTEKIRTSWDGSFVFHGNGNSLITISKRGYLQRRLDATELTDTIELINNGRCLDEVVVVGHYRRPSFSMRAVASKAANGAPRQQGIGFDMNDMLDHIVNYKKHQRRKKAKKILEKY